MSDLRIRRGLLAGTATILLIGDVTWLTFRKRPQPDFTLALTQQSIVAAYAGTLVNFDGQTRRWRVEGKEVSSIKPFLRDDDPQRLGPDSIGLSATIRLEGRGNVEVSRQALLLLASDGICQFALFPPISPKAPLKDEEVTVARLLTVRTDTGETRRCEDRVNMERRAAFNGS